MSKITPNIYLGSSRLLLSESLCILPSFPLKFEIPTQNTQGESIQNLSLVFKFIEDPNAPNFSTAVDGQVVYFTLNNFPKGISAATAKPIGLTVGGRQINLLFFGEAVETKGEEKSKVINFTLSVYEGHIK